ncbi:MAG: hypothetical protein OEW11_01430 [Nitrospirota bacterium]|nr:hypothetical protein [Nitrospirota bacterium]
MRALSVTAARYTLDLLAKARLIFVFTALTMVWMVAADFYATAFAG